MQRRPADEFRNSPFGWLVPARGLNKDTYRE
jgi:hypothetical protein